MTEKSDQSLDGLPTYSESVSTSSDSAPPVPNNIARIRSALINSLVSTHIVPLLHNNAVCGLSSTTLLIIPANVSSLHSPQSNNSVEVTNPGGTFLGESIVGFPTHENPTLIRLQGRENGHGFWHQPAVILELEQQICSQLMSEGYHIAGSTGALNPTSSSPTVPSRLSLRSASSSERKIMQKKPLQDGEASIEAGIQEICLRIESLMGLYETRSGKVVVVRVHFGG